mmetsp:Transcript_14949/g.25543  ORF Transcript_14949/g.25543 Transcript_14949/m.25543 type:complete len:174 (-) Transcript_14949:112-633(-)
MQTVRQRRSRWLIDDPLYIQTGNTSSIFGSLPLLIVKVSGNGNDSRFYVLAQMAFCCQLQFSKYHRTNLLRTQFLLLSAPIDNNLRFSMGRTLNDFKWKTLGFLSSHGITKTPPNDALDIIYGIARVGCHLTFCRHANQFSFRGEGDPGWHCAAAGRLDNFYLLCGRVEACYT